MLNIQAEYDVPIPTLIPGINNYKEYMPLRKRANAACKAAMYLQANNADIEGVEVRYEDIAKIIKKDINNEEINSKDIDNIFSSVEAAVRINEILKGYDNIIVENAIRLRNYVTNKLIEESTNKDPRIRMQALIQLGKITDVGLFTERTEVNITARSTVEITNALQEKLTSIINSDVEDAKIVVKVIKEIDIAEEFKMASEEQ